MFEPTNLTKQLQTIVMNATKFRKEREN